MQIAENDRPDIKIAHSQLDYAKHNLIYQKALAKADISIGTEYDQRSSYAPNYIGSSYFISIKYFKQEPGKYCFCTIYYKQQQALYDGQVSQIENDITSAIAKVKFYQNINNLQQLDFAKQYDTVFQNMLKELQAATGKPSRIYRLC